MEGRKTIRQGLGVKVGFLPDQTESGTISGNPEWLRKQASPECLALPIPAHSGQTPIQVAAPGGSGDNQLAHAAKQHFLSISYDFSLRLWW